MKVMYVYIVECSDDSYYTGVTNNAEKRIREQFYVIPEETSGCCYSWFRLKPLTPQSNPSDLRMVQLYSRAVCIHTHTIV